MNANARLFCQNCLSNHFLEMLAPFQQISGYKLNVVLRSGKVCPVNFEDKQTLFEAVGETSAKELRGQCQGNMACGGCHVILPKEVYTAPIEEEAETLENVNGKTPTSRLACALELNSKFDGCTIKIAPK